MPKKIFGSSILSHKNSNNILTPFGKAENSEFVLDTALCFHVNLFSQNSTFPMKYFYTVVISNIFLIQDNMELKARPDFKE